MSDRTTFNVTEAQASDENAAGVFLHALSYRHPGQSTDTLKDLNLHIPRGSCFGLLGHNGAGKTTLISLLTGIRALQSGELEFRGSAAEARPRLSLVPQEYAFYSEFSARENLEFFARLQGMGAEAASERIDWVSNFCALESVMLRKAGTYSGGLKRRLNLAIGLLNQPDYLYLDEPTVGIDSASRRDILNSIARLKNQGMTIIYTSHYLEEVEQLCDYLAILDSGKIILTGKQSELLELEQHICLQLGSALSVEQLAQLGVEFDACEIAVNDERDRLDVNLHDVPVSKVLRALEELPVEVDSIRSQSGLEELYFRLTKERSSS